jgi:hypothetical protein
MIANFSIPCAPTAGEGSNAPLMNLVTSNRRAVEHRDRVVDRNPLRRIILPLEEPQDRRVSFDARPRPSRRKHPRNPRIERRDGDPSGEDPRREGSPRQDVLASLSFLDAVATKVAASDRGRFDLLREQVLSADDGDGIPEALLHGNLLHAPDHVIVSESGPIAIQWKAAGRGPRLADFAYLMWGTFLKEDWIDAGVRAYRKHVELSEEELERLEGVMYIRPLYLVCFGYRRDLANGGPPRESEWWFGNGVEYMSKAAAAIRAAWRR